jgi:hypothetical protein
MRVKEFPLKDLNKRAWRAVARALGPAGYMRFLQQFEGGGTDRNYTRDRHKILDTVTDEELESELKSVQQEIMRDPAMRAKIIKRR